MINLYEPEKIDNNILDEINHVFDEENNRSEMTYLERKFLNGVVRTVKPKKILEVGVAAGASSSIILNAIKDIDDSFLYSVDYNNEYYRDTSKMSGFIVNKEFQHLSNKWKLYTGGVTAKFIESIGRNIDLCLLDAMHRNPGEFLDFLMVLPYLKKGAVLVIHDIQLFLKQVTAVTCGTLFASIKGKKIILKDPSFTSIENGNIGAIILDDNIKDYITDYFLLQLYLGFI